MLTVRGHTPTLSLILVALWVLGSVSSVTMGGGLHILLFVAIAIMAPRLIWGRKRAG